MSTFSSVLELYMREKNIRTYSLAQFCGMDRSNMYKIINGKRNPVSEEFVYKIAEYMRLKPEERNILLEAYYVELIGHDIYYRRKCVQEFLQSFSEKQLLLNRKQFEKEYMTVNIDTERLRLQHGVITNGRQLRSLIAGVIHMEQQKGKGNVYLIMQPENSYVIDLLVSVGNALERGKQESVVVEHIFCLNNTNDIGKDKKDYNLNCLKNLIPLFMQGSYEYYPYCYYDDIVSHNSRFNLFSSMILTSEYAVIFSAEEEYGMLISGEESTEDLKMHFQMLKEDTSLMARRMNSLEEQLKNFQNIDFNHGGIGYQSEACLIPFCPDDFVEKYLNKSILADDNVKMGLLNYVQQAREMLKEMEDIYIFTEHGIRRFVKTGRMFELPESIYDPLEYNDRIFLVTNVIKECEKGRYRMLRPEAPIVGCEFSIYSAIQNGYLMLPNRQGDRIFVKLRESALLRSFFDYLENIEDRYYYSVEETVMILKHIVKKGLED